MQMAPVVLLDSLILVHEFQQRNLINFLKFVVILFAEIFSAVLTFLLTTTEKVSIDSSGYESKNVE